MRQESAFVLADSVNIGGDRLVTICGTLWRPMLAEFNTHKDISRNTGSVRAIPTAKLIEQVVLDPYIPERFGINQPGMSASETFGPEDDRYRIILREWLGARDHAVDVAEYLSNAHKVHKQQVGRLLEAWMKVTLVATADLAGWENFFSLRISEFAQPEIRSFAECIKEAMDASTSKFLSPGEWHLPLIDMEDRFALSQNDLLKVSAARVAATSYNRMGVRDYEKEFPRYKLLVDSRHLSPLEHQAMVGASGRRYANFTGFMNQRTWLERQEATKMRKAAKKAPLAWEVDRYGEHEQ